jgi:hypothetical protein
MDIRIDLDARAHYEAMAEDITLRYPCLLMPGWDEAGAELQEVARDIARARGTSHRGQAAVRGAYTKA